MLKKIGASCHKREQVVIVSSFFFSFSSCQKRQHIFINITILITFYFTITIPLNSAVIIEDITIEDITSIYVIFIEGKYFIV